MWKPWKTRKHRIRTSDPGIRSCVQKGLDPFDFVWKKSPRLWRSHPKSAYGVRLFSFSSIFPGFVEKTVENIFKEKTLFLFLFAVEEPCPRGKQSENFSTSAGWRRFSKQRENSIFFFGEDSGKLFRHSVENFFFRRYFLWPVIISGILWKMISPSEKQSISREKSGISKDLNKLSKKKIGKNGFPQAVKKYVEK